MKKIKDTHFFIKCFGDFTQLSFYNFLAKRLFLFVFSCVSFIANAQNKNISFDSKKHLSQFMMDVWDSEKGLPSSTLLQVLQTKDGYLWLGSYDGLLRFDGNSFDLYTKSTVTELKTNNIVALTEAKDSTLWIGTQGSGLISYKNGVFKSHGLETEYIEAIHILDNNTIYIGTRSAGLFVYDINQNAFTSLFTKELSSESIYDILEYPRGKIWLGTRNQGIITLENNQIHQVPCEVTNPRTLKLYLDKQKRIWAGTHEGIFIYENNKFVRRFEELAKERVRDLKFDKANNLWIVTRTDIYRHNILTDKLELLTTKIGESFDDVRSIWLDEEDNLWIPTARLGLFRLRDGKFINYTTREGLSYPTVNSVTIYNNKNILVGTSNGTVHQIDTEQNKVFDYPLKTNLSGQEIFNIRQDSSATIWITTYDGLLRKEENGNEKLFTVKDGLPTNVLRLTYQDSKGRFWIGTRGQGLVEYKKEPKTNRDIFEKIDTDRGLIPNFVMAITEDKKGNLLVGTNNGGLAIENNGRFEVFTSENGLPTNLIFNIHCDDQNIIWLATNAGLVRWENETAFVFDGSNGFPNETIFDIVEDEKGYFWLSSNRGVLRINKNELNSLANGKKNTLNWIQQYDKNDGMYTEQCKGATQSVISPQGIIWIPTNDGILHINPNFLPTNSRRPPVYIQKVFLDDELFLEPTQITIKPGQQRLTINFTGLSLRAPEKMQFKYKLDGFDKDWVIAKSNKREAIYTNLPNGTYTFQVIAANDDGIWNNQGANIEIEVEPHIYETWWFIGIIMLSIFGIFWGVIIARTKRIKIKAQELEQIIEMRTTELRSSNEELITQQKVVDDRNQIIEQQNQNIISSINYAKRIQVAMLPTSERIDKLLPQSFILFLPRDIVSGDFYWIEKQSEKIVIATVDCTGHGVPGAFMSLIGNDMLNKVIIDYSITKPNLILDVLNEEISTILKQRETDNRDGMDMNIWTWDKINNTVEFSGAKNPLIYIQNGELHEIKADKISIGGNYSENNIPKYTNHIIKIDTTTVIYTFSDGYQDQFGGKNDRKFMKGKFKKLLLEIHKLPMQEQNKILKNTFEDWKNESPQIDDVLVIGIKIER